jgi:hypothetical protein
MKKKQDQFWKIVKANWTISERAELRAGCEAWMGANKST